MKTLKEWTEFIDSLDVSADERKILLSQAREMSASPVTPKSQTTAGWTKLSTTLPQSPKPQKKSKSAKVLQMPKPKPRPLNELIAEELEQCRGCDGLTCPKPTKWWQVPTPGTYNGLAIRDYVPCQFAAQRAIRQQLRSSEIPSRYLGKTLEDYHVDEDNRIAVKYAQNALRLNTGAYFYGECGSGKTFLAAIVAQDFIRAGKSVIFVKVPRLLADIQSTFNGRGNEFEILHRVESADVVVLDDFGMEKPTQWAGATLCKIIDVRYDNPKLVTIVTSNLSLDDLADRLNAASDGDNFNGSRIADRLYEMSKPILFNGTSRRT